MTRSIHCLARGRVEEQRTKNQQNQQAIVLGAKGKRFCLLLKRSVEEVILNLSPQNPRLPQSYTSTFISQPHEMRVSIAFTSSTATERNNLRP